MTRARAANEAVDDYHRKGFEYWLMDMDDALDRFLERFPSEFRTCLDFSPASLDKLEDWLLERYDSPKSMTQPEEAKIVDGVARYIGQTFRHNLGGKWTIEVDDPDFVFFGLPILVECKGQRSSLCPLTLGTASIDRRKGTYLRTIVESMLRRSSR